MEPSSSATRILNARSGGFQKPRPRRGDSFGSRSIPSLDVVVSSDARTRSLNSTSISTSTSNTIRASSTPISSPGSKSKLFQALKRKRGSRSLYNGLLRIVFVASLVLFFHALFGIGVRVETPEEEQRIERGLEPEGLERGLKVGPGHGHDHLAIDVDGYYMHTSGHANSPIANDNGHSYGHGHTWRWSRQRQNETRIDKIEPDLVPRGEDVQLEDVGGMALARLPESTTDDASQQHRQHRPLCVEEATSSAPHTLPPDPANEYGPCADTDSRPPHAPDENNVHTDTETETGNTRASAKAKANADIEAKLDLGTEKNMKFDLDLPPFDLGDRVHPMRIRLPTTTAKANAEQHAHARARAGWGRKHGRVLF